MSDKRPNIRSAPYISVVACSRNDDHGGNLLHRMQLFVNGLINQCRRHQLRAELILVEWNPPANRSSLKDALSWPSSDSFCDIRIIQVPAEIHGRFKHSDGLPVFQMIAKNVGIRRARDRKSTRLNSSHSQISYAVFCLKKKKTTKILSITNTMSYR